MTYIPPRGLGPYTDAEGASVATDQSTGSTSYTDLTTAGPAVTVNVGASGAVAIFMAANAYISTAEGYTVFSVAVSGATTLAANDDNSAQHRHRLATDGVDQMKMVVLTGLTPGSNTFTMKYRANTGGHTANFRRRSIFVIPI